MSSREFDLCFGMSNLRLLTPQRFESLGTRPCPFLPFLERHGVRLLREVNVFRIAGRSRLQMRHDGGPGAKSGTRVRITSHDRCRFARGGSLRVAGRPGGLLLRVHVSRAGGDRGGLGSRSFAGGGPGDRRNEAAA